MAWASRHFMSNMRKQLVFVPKLLRATAGWVPRFLFLKRKSNFVPLQSGFTAGDATYPTPAENFWTRPFLSNGLLIFNGDSESVNKRCSLSSADHGGLRHEPIVHEAVLHKKEGDAPGLEASRLNPGTALSGLRQNFRIRASC